MLEKLYRQYYNRAFFYVLSLCGNRGSAEEIVQDAFAEACLSLPDDVPSFPCWLMKVCRNLVIDRWRHEKFLSPEEPKDRTGGQSPEEMLLGKERTAALYRALKKLPTGERELLALFYFAQRPTGEIAVILGISPVAARQRLTRARAHLRKIMEEDGYEI